MDLVQTKILAAYEELAEKYNELIEHKPHNAYYDRPNTLALLPDVAGKKVLDAACGPGKYAEILLAQGASVTGFDLSPKMIAHALERNQGKGEFFVHDLSQAFSMFSDESFDLALCALALDYVPDWSAPIREFCRVLKPGGYLVISCGHPFFEYNYNKSENYFALEQVKTVWKGFGKPVEVNSYKRSLQDALGAITDHGFYIDKLVEPRPTAEFAALDPQRFAKLNAFPSFMCVRAGKRG
jgi:ubiquinone/menaquinone biosynthesis C-methylase UbiE